MNASKYWIAVYLCFCYKHLADAYKILIVFPFPMGSHVILGDAYVKHLLDAGHEVTYITPIPKENTHKNLTQIDVSSNFDLDGMKDMDTSMAFDNDLFNLNLFLMSFMMNSMHDLGQSTILHEKVQELLHDKNQTFDLVIAEWMFSNIYSGFSAVFGCPMIWSGSFDLHWAVLELLDESTNPAYTSDVYANILPPFDFIQRVEQLWSQIKISAILKLIQLRELYAYSEAFEEATRTRGRTLPPISEQKLSASMLLSNSHVSIGEATRLPQSVKCIGGYHLDFEQPPLPKNLQTIMDSAKHGVIYFSLGSHLKSKDLPEKVRNDLVRMFGSLEQTVIWKFEREQEELPDNVHIVQWAPQASILAHPNCILFITHGGLLSLIETVRNGVPVVGIPGFGDQRANVVRAESQGYAKKVTLALDMVGHIEEAISEILNNSSYSAVAKARSKIFHDRPTRPGKELVHWVEHVIKTGGAEHLRSPALMVPWYQKIYLDLFAVILVLIMCLKVAVQCVFSKRIVKEKIL